MVVRIESIIGDCRYGDCRQIDCRFFENAKNGDKATVALSDCENCVNKRLLLELLNPLPCSALHCIALHCNDAQSTI